MRRNIFSPTKQKSVKKKRSLRGVITLLIFVVGCLQIVSLLLFRFSKLDKMNQNSISDLSDQGGKNPDGSFNTVPIYLQSNTADSFHSSVHCVGDTHNPSTDWMYKSCKFRNLCFDVESKDFYLVKSPLEDAYQQNRVDHSFVSTQFRNNSLALGGINPRWKGTKFNEGIEKVKWFPKILDRPPKEVFFLPSNVVFVPFHSFAAHNVGHLLWDDFYPIVLLLQLFGLLDEHRLLLMRVDTLPLLYGTCEMRRNKMQRCAKNFERFLPLMGVDPQSFSTAKHVKFETSSTATSSNSKMICAKTAVAGLGMLTDHGLNDHGWSPAAEHVVQNAGKGTLFYLFRNYMMQNLGIFPVENPNRGKIQIVLSTHSSGDSKRDTSFEAQYNSLHQAFPSVSLSTVELSKLTLQDQVKLVSQTNIFLSTCGGGVMIATFLPRGCSP